MIVALSLHKLIICEVLPKACTGGSFVALPNRATHVYSLPASLLSTIVYVSAPSVDSGTAALLVVLSHVQMQAESCAQTLNWKSGARNKLSEDQCSSVALS